MQAAISSIPGLRRGWGIWVVLIGLIALTSATFGQDSALRPADTSTPMLRSLGLELSLNRSTILHSADLSIEPAEYPFLLRRSLEAPLPSLELEMSRNLELQTIWKNELAKQNEYKTLRTILGSVQIGGAAYLTYLRLKRYGLK